MKLCHILLIATVTILCGSDQATDHAFNIPPIWEAASSRAQILAGFRAANLQRQLPVPRRLQWTLLATCTWWALRTRAIFR